MGTPQRWFPNVKDGISLTLQQVFQRVLYFVYANRSNIATLQATAPTAFPNNPAEYLNGDNEWTVPAGSGGTVTSVGLAAPPFLTVGGSPITGAGTLTLTATSEPANQFLASPNGSSGGMTPRAIVPADLPVATTSALGVVKPDGTTITVSGGGLISAVGSGGVWALISQAKISSPTNNLHFTGIPGTYTDLLLVITAKSAATTGSTNLVINFNSDTGNNYVTVQAENYGSGFPTSSTSGTSIQMAMANSSSGFHVPQDMTTFRIEIPYYANGVAYKKAGVTVDFPTNVSPYIVTFIYTHGWLQATAINEIDLSTSDGSNFTASPESIFTLYGRQ